MSDSGTPVSTTAASDLSEAEVARAVEAAPPPTNDLKMIDDDALPLPDAYDPFCLPLEDAPTMTPDAAAAAQALEVCREHGLLIGKGGLYGNVLRMAPLMTTTSADVERGTTTLLTAIAEVQQALHGITTSPAREGAPA